MSIFKKAVRSQIFLRAQLIGISGSGKTWTALALAKGLAGPGGRVALLDSERGSSALYADRFEFDAVNICDIEVRDLGRRPGRYDPERYIAGIQAAEKEGYRVLIVDSLTHAWAGDGGTLDLVEASKGKFGGNKFAAWGIGGPLWTRLMDTIINARLHIICTARSKAEYVQTEERGKSTYKKVGTKANQREESEFEFDLVAEMDSEHVLTVEKTRYSGLLGAAIRCPDETLGRELAEWLGTATPAPSVTPLRAQPAQQQAPTVPSASPAGAVGEPRLRVVPDEEAIHGHDPDSERDELARQIALADLRGTWPRVDEWISATKAGLSLESLGLDRLTKLAGLLEGREAQVAYRGWCSAHPAAAREEVAL